MPTRSLVIVALRLYAIYWLVEGMAGLLSILPFLWAAFHEEGAGTARGVSELLVSPVGMLLITAILWFSASKLATLATREANPTHDFTNLTREDLYAFAFLVLGLYFFLSSISGLIYEGWRYLILFYSISEKAPEKEVFLGQVVGKALTLAASLACVLGARNWSRKLLRRENRAGNSGA